MQFNISCPETGCNKMVELQNEEKLNEIIDKKIGDEIEGSVISDVFEGYKFKITGGFDKDGFAMKNGILAQGKKKVLLTKGCSLLGSEKAITELVSESGDWSEGASFQMI